MENPCKILCFGDSLTVRYTPVFGEQFKQKFPDIDSTILNAGFSGATSRDGLRRLPKVLGEKPDVVVIAFGMNDQGKKEPFSVPQSEFAENLSKMIAAFEGLGSRVLLLSINPLACPVASPANLVVDAYNKVIHEIAHKTKVRLIDINAAWKREFKPFSKGLEDTLHPNRQGVELYSRALLRTIARQSQIVLWQYNGNPCQCNYRCPYCQYYVTDQKGHYFKGPIELWREAFKRAFGNRHLVFYFGHGEPMVGKNWFDVVEMVGEEPNWEMRLISNISPSLKRLLNSRVAREGRLNINASFHPTETTIEKFLNKLLECREHGIEVPIVYTMYPPFFERFKNDFKVFNEHGCLMHVRRFRGLYGGKTYPGAYTDEELRFLAHYCDDATIKYMLAEEPTDGKLTWTGDDFCLIDNDGYVGYCDDFRMDRYCFGNIFEGNVRLLAGPQPFPKSRVSDGTVDGVANIVELGYPQMEKNHILHFSRLGGVYHTPNGVYYKNMHTDFSDSRVRAEYRFPARNLKDAWAILTLKEAKLSVRLRRIAESIFPGRFNYKSRVTLKIFAHEMIGLISSKVPLARKTCQLGRRILASPCKGGILSLITLKPQNRIAESTAPGCATDASEATGLMKLTKRAGHALYARSLKDNLTAIRNRLMRQNTSVTLLHAPVSEYNQAQLNYVVPDVLEKHTFARIISFRLPLSDQPILLLGCSKEINSIGPALIEQGHKVVTSEWDWGAKVDFDGVPNSSQLIIWKLPQCEGHWRMIRELREMRYPYKVMTIPEMALPISTLQLAQQFLGYFKPTIDEITASYVGDVLLGGLHEVDNLLTLKGKRVIEFGPGDAVQTAGLVSLGAKEVTCIELRAENILKAFAARHVLDWRNVNIIHDDMHNVNSLNYGHFDLAVAHGIYYHSLAPFFFFENLLSLANNILLGGFYATENAPGDGWEILEYGDVKYRVKTYYEGVGHFGAGANERSYLFHRDDLMGFFEKSNCEIILISDQPEHSETDKRGYLRFLAKRQSSERRD